MKRQRGTGSIYLPAESSVWAYQIYVNGRRYRGSTGLRNIREAEGFVRRKVAEYSIGISCPNVEKVTVKELVEDLLVRHSNDGNKSLADDESRWRNHIQPFFAHLRATQVSSDLIEKYINDRKTHVTRSKTPPANGTINRELSLLKAAFNYGAEKTPPKVMRTPHFRMLEERNVRKGFLPDAAYIKIAETTTAEPTAQLRPWLRGMFEAAWCYGWREGEIQNLRVSQFDPVARVIYLEPGETKNDVPRRTPPMDETIYQLISACVVGKIATDFIFTRDNGEPIRDFRDAWWKSCVAAGRGAFLCKECGHMVPGMRCDFCLGERVYEGLLFHDLRRTGIRNMIRNGVPEKVAMLISGHKTRSVFDRYNITNYEDLVDAGRKINEGRERIQKDVRDFDHRTATVKGESGTHDKPKGIN